MKQIRLSALRQYFAVGLSVALVLQPPTAYGAAISVSRLAEVPLQGLNPVKPNVMFILDDSGSMGSDYMPDSVNDSHNLKGTPVTTAACADPVPRRGWRRPGALTSGPRGRRSRRGCGPRRRIG